MPIKYAGARDIPHEQTTPTWIGYKDSVYPIFGVHPHTLGEPTEQGPEVSTVYKQAYAQQLVVDLYPCLPKFGASGDEKGLQIFSMDMSKGQEKWHEILDHLKDFVVEPKPRPPLRLAILNESALGESWSHSFGETSFEGMMNVGSKPLQELKSITGSATTGEAIQRMGSGIGGGVGGAMGEAGDLVSAMQNAIKSKAGPLGDAAMKLLEGSRVDFPTIWQGSSYSPQYQLTCRLYNPDPSNPEMYKLFVLTPLAYILAFACPMADSKFTYTFPLMVKAHCSGLFSTPAGYISGVQVVKGGDSNDLTFQQQPGMIDVRFTIDSLFETMVAGTKDSEELEKDIDRPTLKKYFQNLWDWEDFDGIDGEGDPMKPELPIQQSFTIASPLSNPLTDALTSRVGDVFGALGDTLGGALDALGGLADSAMNMIGDAAGMMSELTGMLDNLPLSIDAGFMNISGAMNLLNGDLSFGGLSIPGLELPSIPDIPGFSDFFPNVSLDNLSITGFLDSCDSIWSGQISGIDSFLPQLNTFATYSESISNNGLAGAVTIIDNIQGAVFAITNEIQLAINVTSSALDSASENTVQIGDMIEAQSEKLNWINDTTFLNQWDSVDETLDAMPIDVSSADPENIQAVCDASIGGMQTETSTLQVSLGETTAGL